MAFFHGPTSMVQFLKNQFTKPLGLSLGVNQMRTKKNDLAPKSEFVDFYLFKCSKMAILEKKKSSLIVLLSSLVFFFSSPKNNFI